MFDIIIPKSHSLLEIFSIVFIILISLGIRMVFIYLDKKYKLENKDEKIRFFLGFILVLFVFYSILFMISFSNDSEKISCIESNSDKIEKLQKEDGYSLKDSIFEICVGEQSEKPDYEYDLRGGNYY